MKNREKKGTFSSSFSKYTRALSRTASSAPERGVCCRLTACWLTTQPADHPYPVYQRGHRARQHQAAQRSTAQQPLAPYLSACLQRPPSPRAHLQGRLSLSAEPHAPQPQQREGRPPGQASGNGAAECSRGRVARRPRERRGSYRRRELGGSQRREPEKGAGRARGSMGRRHLHPASGGRAARAGIRLWAGCGRGGSGTDVAPRPPRAVLGSSPPGAHGPAARRGRREGRARAYARACARGALRLPAFPRAGKEPAGGGKERMGSVMAH